MEQLEPLGCVCEHLDLRHYFGKPDALETRMHDFGLVWIAGGNCFVLKRAFEQSGFDRVIAGMLQRDEIVYGGFSAAIMVLMPTMAGIDLCDDSTIVPPGYKSEVDWSGLGLIDYSVVPHYRSDHPEAAVMEDVVRYLEAHGMKYRTLRDGEAIVVIDGIEKMVGQPAQSQQSLQLGGESD